MAHHDDAPGSANGRLSVPALISEYRALQDAFREHVQKLAAAREEVRQVADKEAHAIVAAARHDISAVIVKARQDLRALVTDVQSSIDAHREIAAAGGAVGPLGSESNLGELRLAREIVSAAREETRDVLDGARPELAALKAELDAFTTRLRGELHSAGRAAVAPTSSPVPVPAPVPVEKRPSLDRSSDRSSTLEAAYQASPTFPSESNG